MTCGVLRFLDCKPNFCAKGRNWLQERAATEDSPTHCYLDISVCRAQTTMMHRHIKNVMYEASFGESVMQNGGSHELFNGHSLVE